MEMMNQNPAIGYEGDGFGVYRLVVVTPNGAAVRGERYSSVNPIEYASAVAEKNGIKFIGLVALTRTQCRPELHLVAGGRL